MRLLQEGSFYTNPAIDWNLLQHGSQQRVNDYFSHLSRLVGSDPAFAHHNLSPDIENHTDHQNKVISFERIDHTTGRRLYGVVNLSHRAFENYAFGVQASGELRLLVDSDRTEFGGSGELSRRLPTRTLQTEAAGMHDKPHRLVVPILPAYGVAVFSTPLTGSH